MKKIMELYDDYKKKRINQKQLINKLERGFTFILNFFLKEK